MSETTFLTKTTPHLSCLSLLIQDHAQRAWMNVQLLDAGEKALNGWIFLQVFGDEIDTFKIAKPGIR